MPIHYIDPTANPTLDDPRLGQLPMVQVGDIWAIDVRANFPDRRTPTGDMYKMRPLESVTHLILHHQATPYIGRSTVEDIDEISKIYTFHTQSPDHLWPGIGYHFILSPTTGNLYLTGGVETVRYHALSANPYSIGLCVLGLWQGDTVYSQELQQVLISRLRNVCENIHKGFGHRLKVIGHSEVAPTACPGDWWTPDTSNWFNTIPAEVVAVMKPNDPIGLGDIGLPTELVNLQPPSDAELPPYPPQAGASPIPPSTLVVRVKADPIVVGRIKSALATMDAVMETLKELVDQL